MDSQWIKITQSLILNNCADVLWKCRDSFCSLHSLFITSSGLVWKVHLIKKAMKQCPRKSQGDIGKEIRCVVTCTPTMTTDIQVWGMLGVFGAFLLYGRTQLHSVALRSDAQVGNLSVCGTSDTRSLKFILRNVRQQSWAGVLVWKTGVWQRRQEAPLK